MGVVRQAGRVMTEEEWSELNRKIRPFWEKWQLVIIFIVVPIVTLAITWLTQGRPI